MLGTSAELRRAHGPPCGISVGHAQDRFGVVALAAGDQQIGAGSAEPVARKELVLAQPVVLRDRLVDMVWGDDVPLSPGHR